MFLRLSSLFPFPSNPYWSTRFPSSRSLIAGRRRDYSLIGILEVVLLRIIVGFRVSLYCTVVSL